MMKKQISLLAICAMVAVTATAFAADDAKPEMKPITKVMLARLGWVQSISKNIAYSNYEGVAKDANDLAAQTKKVGEAAPAAFNKEKNLAVSELAKAMSMAAANKDGVAVSAKFGEILGTCNSCHVKLRDK
jgi:cytochrome c556